ncbi:MAG: 2-deoxy-5-keto-D-gluconate 6-phosphate aldolase domain-containing protein [Planctomycetaceae bacterium]
MTDLLFVLAFDHRTSLMRSFFQVEGTPGEQDEARARTAKAVIWEGLRRAVEEGAVAPSEAAALVDTTYGADVVRAAKEAGIRIAVPVEASGRKELAFEFPDWRGRLEALRPDWAKVLVRYNPDGDAEMNGRQRRRLRELSQMCKDAGIALMVELLVPPEPSQEGPAYDAEVRPGLVVRAIEALRGDEISADVWKIEGLDGREECQRVAWAAGTRCVVLGRGADRDAVDRWLRAGARVSGFAGFAIGRSIWWEALRAFFAERASRADAAAAIAAEYARFAEVYRAASAA